MYAFNKRSRLIFLALCVTVFGLIGCPDGASDGGTTGSSDDQDIAGDDTSVDDAADDVDETDDTMMDDGDDAVDVDNSDGDDDDAQVDDDEPEPDGPPPSDAFFDESFVHNIELTLNEANLADLEHAESLEELEEYVEGDVDIDGVAMSSIGIRYKGSFGSLYRCFDSNLERNDECRKLSIKLRFDKYQDQKMFGLKRLNLHAMDADASLMREALSYKLFRDAGVPAPRTVYLRLTINGELVGLYLAVENIDGRFTDYNFEEGDGNLYKEAWPTRTEESFYRDALKTNRGGDEPPSVARMQRFATELAALSESDFRSHIMAWTDFDDYITYFAIVRLLHQWDGPLGWYCGGGFCGNHNFYTYEAETVDKITLIPWDFDNAIWYDDYFTNNNVPKWTDTDASCDIIEIAGSGASARAPSCDRLLNWTVTQLWDDYAARTQELIATSASQNNLNARISGLQGLISAAVSEDPDRALDDWGWGVDYLRTRLGDKRQDVLTDLGL